MDLGGRALHDEAAAQRLHPLLAAQNEPDAGGIHKGDPAEIEGEPLGGGPVQPGVDRLPQGLGTGITFDETGNPSWNLEMGDIKSPSVTLDEIFSYLKKADRICLIAIDEFQVIAKYPEKNIEATLRTYIQHCTNACFIYSGSQRHMMGEIFTSPSRPF